MSETSANASNAFAEDKARYERELQENPEAQRKLEKRAKMRAADARANKPALKASNCLTSPSQAPHRRLSVACAS